MKRTVEISLEHVENEHGDYYEMSCTADGEQWMNGSAPDLQTAIDTALHYAGVHLGDTRLPLEELLP